MKARWLILDHPYAAVTSKDGKFQIEKLPEGQYDFIVWHERTGYIKYDSKRGFKVTVAAGKTNAIKPFLVPVEKFEE